MVRIGLIVWAEKLLDQVDFILESGFESIQINFGKNLNHFPDLSRFATELKERLPKEVTISGLGLYGNAVEDGSFRQDLERVVHHAPEFGAPFVATFTGALTGRSVPDSVPTVVEVQKPLLKIAEQEGFKIAYENGAMGGSWDSAKMNIAHSPRAWELLFDQLGSSAACLEWEPCHAILDRQNPLEQLQNYTHRLAHIHGKDAQWVESKGVHRLPGFGQTDWTNVFQILNDAGWKGSIDIEGYHDHIYHGEREQEGWLKALRYLRSCRAGIPTSQ